MSIRRQPCLTDAFTIATMPAFSASGSRSQAPTTSCKSTGKLPEIVLWLCSDEADCARFVL